ncbi:hypothetical protein KNO15_00005 [Leifsonia shinshuensis]|uniref:hypothetical protein n=1 Tax=Leifsonia shinshuensis TaxID=150026 RepID=UPI001F505019|nr:hypothetical protein [Leifsonia shinshuensis]MCI0155085.1 hypothetical protein [Leifsonia shinshuensis]
MADGAVTVVFVAIRMATTDWGTYVSSRVHWFVHNGHRIEVTPGLVVLTVVFGIAIALGGAAVQVLLAVTTLRGFAWARIVLSILVAIGLLSTLGDVATGKLRVGGWDTLTSDATTAVLAAGIVLLWLPVSSRYLAAVKTERIHYRQTRLR